MAGDMLHGLQLPAMQTPEGEGRSHKILCGERKKNTLGGGNKLQARRKIKGEMPSKGI